jgi:uncharacterized protein YjbI with pentapeptide repeats
MPNDEHVEMLARGAEVGNGWRADHDETPDLSRAGVRGCDLSGFDLSSADVRGADLRGTNLGGANLSSAHLDGANVFKAVLDGSTKRLAVTGTNSSDRHTGNEATLMMHLLQGG